MKKLTLLLALPIVFSACGSGGQNNGEDQQEQKMEGDSARVEKSDEEAQKFDSIYFGKKIDERDARPINEVISMMEDTMKLNAKVSGKVTSVCQKKGCWMKIDRSEGKDIRVTFKDYGFFVPKDLAGAEVVMNGRAYYDTVSVKALKHYAKDAGKPEAEIEKIDEPQPQVAYKATGVKVLQ